MLLQFLTTLVLPVSLLTVPCFCTLRHFMMCPQFGVIATAKQPCVTSLLCGRAAMASDPLLRTSRAEADLERLEQGGVSADFCFEDVVATYPKRAFKW